MASVKPKKYLGQHFLKDENIAKKIVAALNLGDRTIIEVGAGTGVLTKYLIASEHTDFLALDVDPDSIAFLKKTYPDHAHRFLLADFLTFQSEDPHLSIIGNFPYHVSSQLLFKIWEDRNKVDEVVCMIQKEVADRICSSHGSKVYGILSVLLQAFYDIDYLFTVPPQVFHPPPRVQSAVIRLQRNETRQLDCDEALFKKVVKAGFGKRRKTLRNALKDLNLPANISSLELLNLRAEQLTVSAFVSLTTEISRYGSNDI